MMIVGGCSTKYLSDPNLPFNILRFIVWHIAKRCFPFLFTSEMSWLYLCAVKPQLSWIQFLMLSSPNSSQPFRSASRLSCSRKSFVHPVWALKSPAIHIGRLCSILRLIISRSIWSKTSSKLKREVSHSIYTEPMMKLPPITDLILSHNTHSDSVSGISSTTSLRSGLIKTLIPWMPPYLYFLSDLNFFLEIWLNSLSIVSFRIGDSQFVSTVSMMSKLAKYWSNIPLFSLLLSPDTFIVTH